MYGNDKNLGTGIVFSVSDILLCSAVSLFLSFSSLLTEPYLMISQNISGSSSWSVVKDVALKYLTLESNPNFTFH